MPTAPSPDALQPLNYVFIDDENVPNLDLSSIEGKTVHVTLLLGPKKTKLPVEQVQVLMRHAASSHLIRLEKPGKNALDFALAYYLGQAVQRHPGACFHLVSKDGDYNNLIEHLQNQHIRIQKHADASTLTFGSPRKPSVAAKAAAAATPRKPDSFAEIVQYLRKRVDTAPKTRKKLMSDLKAHQGKGATDAQIEKFVSKLEKDHHVSFDEKGKATYHLK